MQAALQVAFLIKSSLCSQEPLWPNIPQHNSPDTCPSFTLTLVKTQLDEWSPCQGHIFKESHMAYVPKQAVPSRAKQLQYQHFPEPRYKQPLLQKSSLTKRPSPMTLLQIMFFPRAKKSQYNSLSLHFVEFLGVLKLNSVSHIYWCRENSL